jgi:hypothetical protein
MSETDDDSNEVADLVEASSASSRTEFSPACANHPIGLAEPLRGVGRTPQGHATQGARCPSL